MLRKIVSAIVILAVLSAVPVMLAGCEQNEYTVKKEFKEENKPVKTEMVVE